MAPIRVLLIPSSDNLGHPFPQRPNHIFERLHDGKEFEVHVVRFQMYDKPKPTTRCIIHEIPHEIKTRTAVEGASLPVPSLTGSPHGDGQAGRGIVKILQKLVESGIERWENMFKMPMLVKEQENASLCFSTDGSPVVEGEATYCISRMEIPPHMLRSFVEVEWGAVEREI
jgi:hypothetical protein